MSSIPRQPITDEFLTELEAAFRMPTITPRMTEQEIQYAAGSYKVLTYCILKVKDYKARNAIEQSG